MERLLEYFSHHTLLASAALAMAVVVAIYEWRARAESRAAVSPQDAVRLINHGALVLDIRPQTEFAAGHLGSARQLPSDQILSAGEHLKKYKGKPVLVYCGTGSLGAAAARQLSEQGFTQAFNLRGGLAAWRAENFPVVRG